MGVGDFLGPRPRLGDNDTTKRQFLTPDRVFESVELLMNTVKYGKVGYGEVEYPKKHVFHLCGQPSPLNRFEHFWDIKLLHGRNHYSTKFNVHRSRGFGLRDIRKNAYFPLKAKSSLTLFNAAVLSVMPTAFQIHLLAVIRH